MPTEMVKNLGKFLPMEPTALIEVARDLNRAVFLARPELRPRDTVGDLNNEVFSANLETRVSEPAKDLK